MYVLEDPYMLLYLTSKNQKSTCHEHDAVKSQNATRAHLDATGIGAIACARHGCFYPHSVINFEKGEGCVLCCLISDIC